MKKYLLATVLAIGFQTLCCFSLKAETSFAFHPDSVPAAIQKLEQYYLLPAKYIKYWKELKAKAEAANNRRDEYFLYKDCNYFYYVSSNADSVRKYTAIVQKLSRQYRDTHGYYYNWLLLSETYNNIGDGEACAHENEKMYDDARDNDSEIGMAYYLFAIASGYLSGREYKKAESYLAQAMQKFYQMRRWDVYAVLASNQIILLSNEKRDEESMAAFNRLDSLANQALSGKLPGLSPRNIAMIKYQAFDKCAKSGNLDVLKKYQAEMEDIYKRYPFIPRVYLYGAKQTYAYLTKDYATQVAYIDSSANYYRQRNSKENMRRMYINEAQVMAQIGQYEEAYHKLNEVIALGDTLSWEKTNKQLNGLSTKYKLKKLELEKQELNLKTRNMQLILAVSIGVALLMLSSFLIVFYRNKLRLKNKLYQRDLKLIEANKKIRKANGMKTVFIQNMNHEIRTPLNSIVGFSNYLTEIISDPELQDISNTIKTNSDNLLKLISDMLSIASLDTDVETPSCLPFSVNKCCKELAREVNVNSNTRFYLRLPKEDFTLVSDKEMVSQVLSNLLHNAAKFTPQGEIELSYRIDTDLKKIFFKVRDTGIGIPSEERMKIFDRFYKVDNFTQGSGLGLSLCAILAQRLNGAVYLDDSYQEGALFIFVLPIDRQDMKAK